MKVESEAKLFSPSEKGRAFGEKPWTLEISLAGFWEKGGDVSRRVYG